MNDQVEIEMSPAKRNKLSHAKTFSLMQRTMDSTWVVDRNEKIEVDINWAIEDFSQRPLETRISSPDFPSGMGNVHVWNLHLYPRSEKVAVYLWSSYNSKALKTTPIHVEYQITLLDCQQKILSRNDFVKHKFCFSGSNFSGYINCLDFQLIRNENVLPNDELFVHCKIRYEVKLPPIKGHFNEVNGGLSPPSLTGHLTERFNYLFNGEMHFSDMKIQVMEQCFLAHKVVLATGSPVFCALLNSKGFIENESNILKIEDFDPSVIEELLRYLYTDIVQNINENLAKNLFIVADKYLVEPLKIRCEVFLSGAITSQNSCELLTFAEDHSAAKLKKIAFDFILENACMVVGTEGMKIMKATHPFLAFQILDALMALDQRKNKAGVVT